MPYKWFSKGIPLHWEIRNDVFDHFFKSFYVGIKNSWGIHNEIDTFYITYY